MTRLRAFASFLYEFVTGDDPLIAVAVALALGVTAVLLGESVQAWWLVPAAVVLVLGDSVRRAYLEVEEADPSGQHGVNTRSGNSRKSAAQTNARKRLISRYNVERP